MADEIGGTGPSLIVDLSEHPERFDFFQATRLLLLHCARQAADAPDALTPAVGGDVLPDQEPIRLRSKPTLGFPSAQVTQVDVSHRPTREPSVIEATVMGLTGPQGVLPMHYTATLIEECQAERGEDHCALRDFLDIFQHRALSFFYRAWQKYRLPANCENAVSNGQHDMDMLTLALECLGGFGLPSLQNRTSVDSQTLVYYVGHFAHFPRTAIALELMLADYFELRVKVESFVGQWLQLGRRDQSRLALKESQADANCILGQTLVVGTRMWSRQTKFRICLGPLHHDQFRDFLPGREGLRRVRELVRLFVGQQFDFDVQLTLLRDEVPRAQMRFGTDSRLGWNSWLLATPPGDDVDDAIFELSEDFV